LKLRREEVNGGLDVASSSSGETPYQVKAWQLFGVENKHIAAEHAL
jgi:hypothetical protein